MTADNRWQHEGPEADPWSAMSLIMSGVLLWGAIGYGLSEWLHSKAYMGAGVVVGGVLGVWLVYLRYGRDQSGPPATVGPVVLPGRSTVTTTPDASVPSPTATLTTPPTANSVEEDTP